MPGIGLRGQVFCGHHATMTRLIAMCGLSFSGKTTLARQIARCIGAEYLSLDAINEERGLCGGEGIPPAEWERTSAIAIERASNSIGVNVDVVLDDTLCFKWLRDRYAGVAKQHNAEFILVYVETPISAIREAMAHNQTVLGRNPIRVNVFEEHARVFEPPTRDERPLIFNRTEPAEQWLASHFGSRAALIATVKRSAETRKDTTAAMSSGVLSRSSGGSLLRRSTSSCDLPLRNRSVAVGPGATAFTVMLLPRRRTSRLILLPWYRFSSAIGPKYPVAQVSRSRNSTRQKFWRITC